MKERNKSKINSTEVEESELQTEVLQSYEIRNKNADKLFTMLFNSSPIGIYIINYGKFQFVNPKLQILTGYNKDELLGIANPMKIVFHKDRNTVRENAIKMLKGDLSSPYEFRLVRKNKEIIWVMETITSIQKFGKRIVLGNIIDINERKKAEDVSRESQKRYRYLIEHSRDAIFVVSPEAQNIDVNPMACRMVGYERKELLQMSIKNLIYPDYLESGLNILDKLVKRGAFFGEINLKAKDGSCILAEINATILPDGNYLGAVRDITGRKQMEKEMAQLERLNLVGQMAAGIGHEIRNPMTTVRGFLQILKAKKEYSDDKQYFELMIEELDRTNSIITEFLTVARNRPENLKRHNLNSVIKAILPLITADAMNADKDVEAELEEIPELNINEKEIRQLILNLVRNGLEAMECGELLTIRTCFNSKEVILSVQDKGKGIEPDAIGKIGTPFFTTKETGTGLGLAVCYGIASRHNARIDFETSKTGTTFFVRFQPVM